jgi:hypothetical protein
MLEKMIEKLSEQPAYMAWYLHEYSADEKIPFHDLKDKLQLSLEQLNTLAMCKAPDGRMAGFVDRLKALEAFTGVNHFLIASIIRRVDALIALKNSESDETLLAARKQDNSSDAKSEVES